MKYNEVATLTFNWSGGTVLPSRDVSRQVVQIGTFGSFEEMQRDENEDYQEEDATSFKITNTGVYCRVEQQAYKYKSSGSVRWPKC